MIVYTHEWPEACQRFWCGMARSQAFNGEVIVPPEMKWIADELRAANYAGRMPSDEAIAALAHRGRRLA